MNYYAFGLSIHSQSLAIPEFPAIASDSIPQCESLSSDVVIEEDDPDQWPDLACIREGIPALRARPGELQLDVEDVGRFRICDGTKIAWSRWSPSVRDQDIRSYLLGSALGALLIQRNILVMHGNALTKNGEAIVCLGDSGAGKSTLAFALMRTGWELLADDLVAITPAGIVLPGVQRIKLWKDAAEEFLLDPSELTPILAGVDKFQLSGTSIRSAQSGVPLKVWYVLPEELPADRSEEGVISSTPLDSDRAVMASLLANVYRPLFAEGLGMQGSNFLAIATLLRKIPHLRLSIPFGIGNLPERLAGFDLLNPTIL
jgi:hypothetical protein